MLSIPAASSARAIARAQLLSVDAVPLGAVGRKRVRELALKAADFSELTFERVTSAIEAGQAMIGQLEDLRKRGRTLLESVESACANGHALAPSQAPQ